MAIRSNRYYNDPELGQAFTNIASMFAAPDYGDVRNAVEAGAKRAEASRLAQLFDYAQSPDFDKSQFDRIGQAAGVWTPSAGYYGVDTAADTSRSNNTADNVRALKANAADNQRAIEVANIGAANEIAKLYAAPVKLGQGETAYLPPETAAHTGLPGMLRGNINVGQGDTVYAPSGQTFTGAPKPLGDSELKARILGTLSPEDQRRAVVGDSAVEQVIGPDGKTPQFVYRSDAVGKQPFTKEGAQGNVKNGMAVVNGRQVAVLQASDGRWVESQTGAPIPPNTQVFQMPQPTGTNEQLGLTKSSQGGVEQKLIDAAIAKDTAVKLRDLVAKSPASQGAVGWLRGTAQNVLATGGELGQFFGGRVSEVMQDIKRGAADAELAGAFDQNIPAIDMLSNLLAFQYAKMTTGERLSNEMLRASKTALGLDGITANQTDSMARLNQAVERIESQEKILRDALSNGTTGVNSAAPPPPAANNITGADNVPVVNSPQEALKLPKGTKFRTPDGQLKVRP